jgi:hypothetical protein
MPEPLIKIALKNENGRQEFQFTVQGMRDLISALIDYLRAIPAEPSVYKDISISETPIGTDFFCIVQHPASDTDAVLVVRSGQAELQFAVPLAALMQALEGLKLITEKNPDAPKPH